MDHGTIKPRSQREFSLCGGRDLNPSTTESSPTPRMRRPVRVGLKDGVHLVQINEEPASHSVSAQRSVRHSSRDRLGVAVQVRCRLVKCRPAPSSLGRYPSCLAHPGGSLLSPDAPHQILRAQLSGTWSTTCPRQRIAGSRHLYMAHALRLWCSSLTRHQAPWRRASSVMMSNPVPGGADHVDQEFRELALHHRAAAAGPAPNPGVEVQLGLGLAASFARGQDHQRRQLRLGMGRAEVLKNPALAVLLLHDLNRRRPTRSSPSAGTDAWR